MGFFENRLALTTTRMSDIALKTSCVKCSEEVVFQNVGYYNIETVNFQ